MAIANNLSNKNTNIELSIQISLSGLSFSILNKDTNTIVVFKVYNFEKKLNPIEVLERLKQLFLKETVFKGYFENIIVIHDNDLSTLVPISLFDENYLADYLKFNSKILKSDFIAYDNILENKCVNVYVPYININNYIYDKFGSFTYKHISTVLIESILQIEKESGNTNMYVNVSEGHFEVIVVNKSNLVLYNTFSYNTKEDFIYYILFTAEQLNLDPENLNLVLIGNVKEGDELYNIAYKYIRNITFGARNETYKYLGNAPTKHSNFTLLNSF